MKRALILLALLASPAIAGGKLNSNGDFVPYETPHDSYMDPELGRGTLSNAFNIMIALFGDHSSYNSSTSPPAYIQEHLKREQQQTGQIYAKPDPVICQWEPKPNAVVCHR